MSVRRLPCCDAVEGRDKGAQDHGVAQEDEAGESRGAMKPTREQLAPVEDALLDYARDEDIVAHEAALEVWSIIAPVVRDATLEEAAKACEAMVYRDPPSPFEQMALSCAVRIRGLKGKAP